jgi:hypothetical protein
VNGPTERMRRPCERGPRSAAVLQMLDADPTQPVEPALLATITQAGTPRDPLRDGDLQLALMVLYELHYRGIEGIADEWEWHPDVLRIRGELERIFEPRCAWRRPRCWPSTTTGRGGCPQGPRPSWRLK